MTSILSNIQNLLNLSGGQQVMPAGFIGPQQPPVQGPPSVTSQVSDNYQKISDQPGFNNALFKLGSTLLAARDRGMGLGEGLLLGQEAYNSEADRAKKAEAAKAAAKFEMQKFMAENAFKLNAANLDQNKFGLEQKKYGLDQQKFGSNADIEKQKLALEYFKANQERNKPQSPTAKLTADFNSGLIDQDTYKRALAKEIAPLEKNYKQPQLQAASFADRMAKSEGLLQPFEASGVNMVNNTASTLGKIPLVGDFLENKTLSEEQQLYRNAATEWVRAKLRKESGAAIGKDEMEKEFRTYFPTPGDTPKVILQKAELRKNNTASMIKQASGAYEEQYLGETPGNTTSAPAMPKAGVSPAPGKVLIFDAQGNIVK